MNYRILFRIRAILIALAAVPAIAANHPSVTGKNADCSSCHADMLTGTSVHAQGEISCLLCHTAAPDQKTSNVTIKLTLPKENICFACHERTAMQQHFPESRRECLACHDAHRSARTMLLRRDVDASYQAQQRTQRNTK